MVQKCLKIVFLYTWLPTNFSSSERKKPGELKGWDSSWRPSVRLSMRAFTLSSMNISETSRPVVIKVHLEHHWGGRLFVLGFGTGRIRTLVSMATDSSHIVIMGKIS